MLENDEKPRDPTTQWTNGILITIYDNQFLRTTIDMFSIGNEISHYKDANDACNKATCTEGGRPCLMILTNKNDKHYLLINASFSTMAKL